MTNIFETIIRQSFSASWLIAAVVLVRFLGKKIPKKYVCVLWLLVGVRLVFPFTIESKISLVPKESVKAAAQFTGFMKQESVEDIFLSALKEDKQYTIPELQIPPIYENNMTMVSEINKNTECPPLTEHVSGTPMPADSNPTAWLTILTIVWFSGMIVMLAYFLISWQTLKRMLSEAVILREDIWQSEYVDSPFIMGLVRPLIYIPYHMTEESLRYVLAHERVHIKRGDNWTKAAAFLLVCVYWFHPLVWLSYVLLCRDIEMACDEQVIAELKEADRKAYSLALLSCHSKRTWYHACPVGFGEADAKERVLRIKKYQKPTGWMLAAAVVICAVIGVCFLTSGEGSKNAAGNAGQVTIETLENLGLVYRKENLGDLDGNGVDEYLEISYDIGTPENEGIERLYWNGEHVFSYGDSARSGRGQIEYLDIDHDGEKEIFHRYPYEMNDTAYTDYRIWKRREEAWLPLEELNVLPIEDVQQMMKQYVPDIGEISLEENGGCFGNWGLLSVDSTLDRKKPQLEASFYVWEKTGDEMLQGVVQVTFDYDEAGKVRVLDLVHHSGAEADQENHTIDIFTFLETDGDKNLIEKEIYELGDFDQNGYPERITIKTIRKENGISKLIFSWSGKEAYEYESAHRILTAEAEYLDLDQDGVEEVFIRMLPEVNGGMAGAQLMEYVVLKVVNGAWKPLETTQDEKNPSYETNSFPVSVVVGKEKNTIVISCEGYEKELTHDVSEHYEHLRKRYTDQPVPEMVERAFKKMDRLLPGYTFGYLADGGIHNIKSSTFENKNCLVAEQRVEGLGGIYDPLGYLYIYFDYDSAGKIHILHMAFHPMIDK